MTTSTTGEWPIARSRGAAVRPMSADGPLIDDGASGVVPSVALRLITWVALGSASWLMLGGVSVLLVGAFG